MVLLKKNKRRKKVAVAMSGGIDSSVAAALLKKQGYDVVGLFMKLWQPGENLAKKTIFENKCCSLEAENRARKVAKTLNIPFYVFDFQEEFKKRIVDCFLKEHKKGLTPNPCVVCNKEIKFGLLLEKSLKINTDHIATGHYAKIKTKNQKPKTKNYYLFKAKDKEKDQSYFLWQLSQKQLKRVLFPIGDYKRKEVEKLAKKFKLPFSGVKKSQEICFIPKTGEEASSLLRPFVKTRAVEDFLSKYLKENPGLIVDTEGRELGKHQGLYFYTIGQRKGIKLPAGPYYVLDKDFKNNVLIVTKKEKDLFKKELTVKNVNWIFGKEPLFPLKVKAKIRYRQKASKATISKKSKVKTYQLKFARGQRAITPGQSAVFYTDKGELLGGGIIS